MFVMTVDQRNSSKNDDLIPYLEHELLQENTAIHPLRGFQRTAGDEAQAVFDDPHDLLTATLFLSRQGRWHIGIGSGEIEKPLPENTREGRGAAFIHARKAVERAKKSTAHIAFESNSRYSNLIEATLQLLMSIEESRNNSWQQAGELYSQGFTQKEIAQKLDTYQSAVSRSLKLGHWKETRRILSELEPLLTEEV